MMHLWARFWRRLGRALTLAYEENCLGIAKGAAYSALLALFPVITTLASILVRVQAEPVSDLLSRLVSRVVPPGSEGLVLYSFAERGERPATVLALAGLVTLWGASGVMLSLMEGFNRIYAVAARPFLQHRMMAVALVFASVVPVVGASALILLGARSERAVIGWLGVIPLGQEISGGVLIAGRLARYGVALATIVVVSALLYHLGPNRRQRWGAVWRGATLATLLWLASISAFAWWVRNIARYNVLYGSIGAVIALVVWMYVLAVIALFGCAFNAVWERSAGRRRRPAPADS